MKCNEEPLVVGSIALKQVSPQLQVKSSANYISPQAQSPRPRKTIAREPRSPASNEAGDVVQELQDSKNNTDLANILDPKIKSRRRKQVESQNERKIQPPAPKAAKKSTKKPQV